MCQYVCMIINRAPRHKAWFLWRINFMEVLTPIPQSMRQPKSVQGISRALSGSTMKNLDMNLSMQGHSIRVWTTSAITRNWHFRFQSWFFMFNTLFLQSALACIFAHRNSYEGRCAVNATAHSNGNTMGASALQVFHIEPSRNDSGWPVLKDYIQAVGNHTRYCPNCTNTVIFIRETGIPVKSAIGQYVWVC